MTYVPVTETQKKSPLYKYYELDVKPVPSELMEKSLLMESGYERY